MRARPVPPLQPRPELLRSPLFTITPVLIAYIILKRAMGYALFERALAVTVTEITGIVLTLLIVREVLLIVRNFEDAVADITFRQLGLPPRVYETPDAEDLYREVKRSRRFKHPLSLMLVKPRFDPDRVGVNQLVLDIQRAMASRYVQVYQALIDARAESQEDPPSATLRLQF